MTISLDDIPTTATDLEDYSAALFHTAGYFVRKQIHEIDFTEILELDVVAIDYKQSVPVSILCEVKSGGWGFPDLFKVVGWMRYLSIDKAAFFVSKGPRNDIDEYNKKINPLGLTLTYFDDFTNAARIFADAGFNDPIDIKMLEIWRFEAMVERNIIVTLRQCAKSAKPLKGASVALSYYRLVNDDLFFTNDIYAQAKDLYGAYMAHPKLSLGLCQEIETGTFDAASPSSGNPILNETMFQNKHLIVQGTLFLEHLARLSILKCLADFHIAVKNGQEHPPGVRNLRYYSLPQSFRTAYDVLKDDSYLHLYPLFWQIFLWGFGGFYLEDRVEDEFIWLSQQSGIPVEEIPKALKAFDVLFPCSGGWLVTVGPSHCKLVKLFPGCFRGMGAKLRLDKLGIDDYEKLGYKDYTAKDLGGWHNTTYEFLKASQR